MEMTAMGSSPRTRSLLLEDRGLAGKARRVLNWQPKVGFKELAIMMTEADLKLAEQERILRDHGGTVASGSEAASTSSVLHRLATAASQVDFPAGSVTSP